MGTVADRDWFAANPKRRYRLRPVWRGEYSPSSTHVLVEQTEDGAHVRTPIWFGNGPLPADDDYELEALDRILTRGRPVVVKPSGRVREWSGR